MRQTDKAIPSPLSDLGLPAFEVHPKQTLSLFQSPNQDETLTVPYPKHCVALKREICLLMFS